MTATQQDAGAMIGQRIDRMPFSGWHVRLTGVLGTAHFFDAIDATILAFVLPVLVTLWDLTPTEAGLLISASYAGQAVGAIGAGTLAEKIGRIATLRLSIVIMALASLACAFSPSYIVLFAIRAIQGLGLGGEVPIAAAYMNEVCPARFRGRAIVAIQLLFGTGVSVASFLALWLIPHYGWRSMFIAGTLPIVMVWLLPRLLPESPRWLAATGRTDEAEAAIGGIERKVYKTAPPELVYVPELSPLPTMSVKPTIAALLAPALWRPTLSAWIVAICGSLVSFALIGWMPTIYQTVYHLPVDAALRYSALSGLMSLCGAVLAILIIDRAGRKLSMILGFVGMACCTTFLAVAGLTLSPLAVAIVVSMIFVLMTLPIAGLYAYAPELYPTPIRAFGMGVASSWIRIAAIIVPPVVGMLLDMGSVRAVFAFLAVAAVTGAVGMAWLGVETTPGRRKVRAAAAAGMARTDLATATTDPVAAD